MIKKLSKNPATLIASGFYTGYLPLAPGTWGSLAILPVAAFIQFMSGNFGLLIFSVILFFVGLLAVSAYIQIDGRRDPPEVTIDEMAAQCLVLAAASLSLWDYVIAFALFRLFDIFKPWPISLAEKRLPSALAVMADDVGAALYAIVLLRALHFVGVL